ncbi:MAG: hypothetical protein ACI8UO_002332 [Verrucomicrobiales bacterium]|jgi:hypothetical protein
MHVALCRFKLPNPIVMTATKFSSIDRRKFLRGAGIGLALPWFETFAASAPEPNKKRLACFYLPDGVPMPPEADPAHADWSWFPQKAGRDFQFTNCLKPLESLRSDVTILGGLSHPGARGVHGHSNADQFLTGAVTTVSGQPYGEYKNSISLDQVFAAEVGGDTRFASLIMSTDGGTGGPRGSTTMSFDQNGRHMPAEHRPKQVFDKLFVAGGDDEARKLAMSSSALDTLMEDARSLQRNLSLHDQKTLEDYLQSVRETELRVEKARQWLSIERPEVDSTGLNLEATPDMPKEYLRAMYDLIFLAFRTDSTRVATYQIGQEGNKGISNNLAKSVGQKQAHELSHKTKEPGGWANFGRYIQFLNEQYVYFAERLKNTPEGAGSMLDNTLLFYGSASSGFHLSRNYPLILTGAKNFGFQHGQFLRYGEKPPRVIPQNDGGFKTAMDYEELPLSNLYLTMLQKMGLETARFADSTGTLSEI